MKQSGRKTSNRRQATEPTESSEQESDLSWKIISLLQEDGRMPYSTIAERVGVSEGTVRNRVNALLDQHVMEISANVLPHAFGYSWNSNVFVKINAGADIEKVARRLSALSETYYVAQITGMYDLVLSAYHRDREHFREFLNTHFYGRPDILSVDASVNLKVYKMQLKWKADPTEAT